MVVLPVLVKQVLCSLLVVQELAQQVVGMLVGFVPELQWQAG